MSSRNGSGLELSDAREDLMVGKRHAAAQVRFAGMSGQKGRLEGRNFLYSEIKKGFINAIVTRP